MIRRYIISLLICSIIFSLTGCAKHINGANPPNSITITVAVRSGERSHWQETTAGFCDDNPDVKLRFIELSSELEQYRLLTAAMSSGECAFDILEVEDVWVDELVKRGYITPILGSNIIDSDYLHFINGCFERDGELYALPFQMDIGMLFASRDYKTESDAISFSDLKEQNYTATYINETDDKDDITSSIMELVGYTGNDIGEALKMYKDIYGDKGSSKEMFRLFIRGDLPAIRGWSNILPTLRDEQYRMVGDFRLCNLPQGKTNKESSVAKVIGLGVSTLTTQKDICERFLKYCESDAFQINWIKHTGAYPIKKSIYNSAEVKSEWNHITPMAQRIEQIQLRPKCEDYVQKADRIKDDMYMYLSGELSLSDISSNVRKFLK